MRVYIFRLVVDTLKFRHEKERKTRGENHLLDVVVGISVNRSVEPGQLVVDDANVGDLEDPRGADVEHLWKLERDGLILNMIAHTCCRYANYNCSNARIRKG